jgi:hypothetical protein
MGDIDGRTCSLHQPTKGGIMRNPVSLFFVGAAMLFSVSVSTAQETPWHIVTSSGDTLNASSLDSLQGNQLFATGTNGLFLLPLDSIATIHEQKEGDFWTGAAIGTIAGGVIGAVAGSAAEPKGAWFKGLGTAAGGGLGLVGGFVLGGVIGGASGHDETYDLSSMTPNVRIQIVHNLLSE